MTFQCMWKILRKIKHSVKPYECSLKCNSFLLLFSVFPIQSVQQSSVSMKSWLQTLYEHDLIMTHHLNIEGTRST